MPETGLVTQHALVDNTTSESLPRSTCELHAAGSRSTTNRSNTTPRVIDATLLQVHEYKSLPLRQFFITFRTSLGSSNIVELLRESVIHVRARETWRKPNSDEKGRSTRFSLSRFWPVNIRSATTSGRRKRAFLAPFSGTLPSAYRKVSRMYRQRSARSSAICSPPSVASASGNLDRPACTYGDPRWACR